MKKIIVIGDIHGRDIWKAIIEQNPDCTYIFMGDYFDTRDDISPYTQKDNFDAIVKFKKTMGDDVILLVGNHELHYMIPDTQYAGFNSTTNMLLRHDIDNRLDKLIANDVLVATHQIGNILFSHAGVSTNWLEYVDIAQDDNMSAEINHLMKVSPKAFRVRKGLRNHDSGDDITEGPLWIRPRALEYCRTNHFQIIGHTSTNKIYTYNGIMNVDSLEHGKYLCITTDELGNQTFTEKTLPGYAVDKEDKLKKLWKHMHDKLYFQHPDKHYKCDVNVRLNNTDTVVDMIIQGPEEDFLFMVIDEKTDPKHIADLRLQWDMAMFMGYKPKTAYIFSLYGHESSAMDYTAYTNISKPFDGNPYDIKLFMQSDFLNLKKN